MAVVLAAGLKSDADLLHRRIADELSVDVDMPLAEGSAHNEPGFANVGKYSIGIAVLKKRRALAGILEQRNRVRILARIRHTGGGKHGQCKTKNPGGAFHVGHSSC